MSVVSQSFVHRTGAAAGTATTQYHLCDTEAELPAGTEGDIAYAKDTDKLFKKTSTWVELVGGGGSGITQLTGDVTAGPGSGSQAATIASGTVTEAKQVLADNTTNDVSTTKHGYAPKAPNDTTKFLRGDATWNVPPGGGEAFPVGSVFIGVVSTNPNTLLGYGTWSAFAAGKVLVGLDAGQTEFDTVEETGGAKTHTLVTAEIPAHTHVQDSHNHTQDSHNHTQNAHTHTQDSHTHNVGSAADISSTTGAGNIFAGSTSSVVSSATVAVNQNATAVNQAATATNQAATAVNQNAGGDGAHNNLQPYIVVYMWKRTA